MIKFSKQAVKKLKKLNLIISKRIYSKIKELLNNPIPHDAKIIVGYKEKLYRIRVGDYRLLYEIDNQNQIIAIIKIDKRSKAYM